MVEKHIYSITRKQLGVVCVNESFIQSFYNMRKQTLDESVFFVWYD